MLVKPMSRFIGIRNSGIFLVARGDASLRHRKDSLMFTWVFETITKEQPSVLTCVVALHAETGWERATWLLKEAGYTPVKSNGHYGFLTKARLVFDDPAAYRSTELVSLQQIVRRGK